MTKAAHAARIRACGAWSDVKDGGEINVEKCKEAAEEERSLSAAIDALAEGESILREALARIESMLTNLQPHIVQACYPEKVAFIDNYIDPALEAARSVLARIPTGRFPETLSRSIGT